MHCINRCLQFLRVQNCEAVPRSMCAEQKHQTARLEDGGGLESFSFAKFEELCRFADELFDETHQFTLLACLKIVLVRVLL